MLDLVPVLFSFVRDPGISVATALDRWVKDIKGGLSPQALSEYLKLWDVVSGTVLSAGQADKAFCRLTSDGTFSVSSAYKLFSAANTRFSCARPI